MFIVSDTSKYLSSQPSSASTLSVVVTTVLLQMSTAAVLVCTYSQRRWRTVPPPGEWIYTFSVFARHKVNTIVVYISWHQNAFVITWMRIGWRGCSLFGCSCCYNVTLTTPLSPQDSGVIALLSQCLKEKKKWLDAPTPACPSLNFSLLPLLHYRIAYRVSIWRGQPSLT